MASIIKSNGTIEIVEPKNGTDFSLSELKQAIGGGYVEVVSLDRDTYLVVDEEGLLKNLPYNYTATKLYNFISPIVGDALVCKKDQIK